MAPALYVCADFSDLGVETLIVRACTIHLGVVAMRVAIANRSEIIAGRVVATLEGGRSWRLACMPLKHSSMQSYA